ncbi:MAG: trypsin-like peptidase domain-containing protein [Acidobacteria bacterium]|nr:trypsin-like peptidase domain-containing protein [Acidobacteriota bacterium]
MHTRRSSWRNATPIAAMLLLPATDIGPAQEPDSGSAQLQPVRDSASVFCPVCGAQNRAGSRFCLKDGSPLPAIDPVRYAGGFLRAPETLSAGEIQETVRRATRSVVRVRVKAAAKLRYPVIERSTRLRGYKGRLESFDDEGRLAGSGFAVSPDGEIVTNAHVASPFGTQARLTVETQDGRSFPARVLGIDRASDLALLKIDSGSIPPLTWGDSDQVRLGEETWAIGNPLDLGISVTRGTISSMTRLRTGLQQVENFLHSDASITGGNSGGPLVDLLGRVVGVSNMGFHQAKGQGYSIPSKMARLVMERLRQRGTYERGFLGVQVRPVDAEALQRFTVKRATGSVVESVLAGSPAAGAGFNPGDVLFGINGREAAATYLLQEAVASVGPGVSLRMTLDRTGQVLELPVTTVARPEEPRIDPILDLARYLMVRVEEEPGGKGVTLRMTDEFSVARKYGLSDGCRLTSVLPAQDWPDTWIDLVDYKKLPGVVQVGGLDDLRRALGRAYLGGRFAAAIHCGEDQYPLTSVAFDESWAIVL